MQQVVQNDFDGALTLYEWHVSEKNPIGRLKVQIRSVYLDEQEDGDSSDNSEEVEVGMMDPHHV